MCKLRVKHMATSSNCIVQKQAIAIARSGREEWRDREREHERQQTESGEDRESEREPNDKTTEEQEEASSVNEAVLEDEGLELEDLFLTNDVDGNETNVSLCA